MTSATISFAGFSWTNSKGCRACSHVMAELPILLFLHEANGSLQFLCGADGHRADDAVRVHVSHILDKHPDLLDMPVVDPGHEADRSAQDRTWTVRRLPDDY